MNVFRFKTINTGYKSLVRRLLLKPDDYQKVDFPNSGKGPFINKRSRYHLRNVHILFKDPGSFTEFKVACPNRSKIMNDYMKKETYLFDKGVIDAEEMGKASKMWKLIANPDRTVNANYGFMVYHLRDAGNPKFTKKEDFMSQFDWCKNRLSKNLYTLQAIMHFNRPKDQYIENLDQPCTVFCQFTVTNNQLNFHSYMRSNDIIYGTPYNLAYFKVLQGRMLLYLNSECDVDLSCGYLCHSATSIHLYEDRIDIAKSIVGYQ